MSDEVDWLVLLGELGSEPIISEDYSFNGNGCKLTEILSVAVNDADKSSDLHDNSSPIIYEIEPRNSIGANFLTEGNIDRCDDHEDANDVDDDTNNNSIGFDGHMPEKLLLKRKISKSSARKYSSYLIAALNVASSSTVGVFFILDSSSSMIYRFAVNVTLLSGQVVACLPVFSTLASIATEVLYFTIDGTHRMADRYTADLSSNTPVVYHLRALSSDGSWLDLRRRGALSSLDWMERQLLDQTSDVSIGTAVVDQPSADDDCVGESKTSLIDLAQKCVENEQRLIEDAERGDEEAQYVLARVYCKPTFEKASKCASCNRRFGLSLFRHHCRRCARSFCGDHSSESRPVPRYGYGLSVRVCAGCAKALDVEALRDRVLWRLMRTRSYLSGNLLPYFTIEEETPVDKALR